MMRVGLALMVVWGTACQPDARIIGRSASTATCCPEPRTPHLRPVGPTRCTHSQRGLAPPSHDDAVVREAEEGTWVIGELVDDTPILGSEETITTLRLKRVNEYGETLWSWQGPFPDRNEPFDRLALSVDSEGTLFALVARDVPAVHGIYRLARSSLGTSLVEVSWGAEGTGISMTHDQRDDLWVLGGRGDLATVTVYPRDAPHSRRETVIGEPGVRVVGWQIVAGAYDRAFVLNGRKREDRFDDVSGEIDRPRAGCEPAPGEHWSVWVTRLGRNVGDQPWNRHVAETPREPYARMAVTPDGHSIVAMSYLWDSDTVRRVAYLAPSGCVNWAWTETEAGSAPVMPSITLDEGQLARVRWEAPGDAVAPKRAPLEVGGSAIVCR